MTLHNHYSSTAQDRSLPGDDVSARKRLFRHPTEKMLGGVAGGMADYLSMDVSIVRLLWVLVALFTAGAALWLYLALWLLLPVGDAAHGELAPPAIRLDDNVLSWLAWGLIGLGLLWLLANFGILPVLWRGLHGVLRLIGLVFWPVVLLAGGWLLLSKLGHTQALSSKIKEGMPEGETLREGVQGQYQALRQKTPLKRSLDDRMLLGVCAGIAHWLNIDPLVVRILWALFALGSLGTGVILYVILALIMPEDDSDGAIETVEGEVLDPINHNN